MTHTAGVFFAIGVIVFVAGISIAIVAEVFKKTNEEIEELTKDDKEHA